MANALSDELFYSVITTLSDSTPAKLVDNKSYKHVFESLIDAVPKFVRLRKSKKCGICLSTLAKGGASAYLDICGHGFCITCTNQIRVKLYNSLIFGTKLIRLRPKCPLCRTQFSTILIDSHEHEEDDDDDEDSNDIIDKSSKDDNDNDDNKSKAETVTATESGTATKLEIDIDCMNKIDRLYVSEYIFDNFDDFQLFPYDSIPNGTICKEFYDSDDDGSYSNMVAVGLSSLGLSNESLNSLVSFVEESPAIFNESIKNDNKQSTNESIKD